MIDLLPPDEDDLDFARDTLGPEATHDEVVNLANIRIDRDTKENHTWH